MLLGSEKGGIKWGREGGIEGVGRVGRDEIRGGKWVIVGVQMLVLVGVGGYPLPAVNGRISRIHQAL